MSFSSTPLGQGRRLDHYTFLGKPNPNAPPKEPSASRAIPSSYAYGAPTLQTRSPPKHGKEPSAPAGTSKPRSHGPRVVTTPPDPAHWAVKDTSVQIANAIQQAAGVADMPTNQPPPSATTNPNSYAWASGSQTKARVPRSTSVEYEKETQSIIQRRLNPPPSRSSQMAGRRPLGKAASVRHVPDSEGEDEPSQTSSLLSRAKSPFGQALDMAQAAVQPLSIFMRQRSREPEQPAPTANGRGQEESYDYSQEERDYQAEKEKASSAHRRTTSTANRKNKISEDNRAYKPSASDFEESEEEVSDGGRRRRRKKGKRDSVGGPLTTLPVAGYDKRRKRKGKKGGNGGDDDDAESGSEEEEQISEQRSMSQRASVSRTAQPLQNAIHRASVSREMGDSFDASGVNDTFDVEQGLQSIPELDEPPLIDDAYIPAAPKMRRGKFSVGGFLGRLVHLVWRMVMGLVALVFRALSFVTLTLGWILGAIYDVTLKRPVEFFAGRRRSKAAVTATKYLVTGLGLYAAWYFLRDPLSGFVPSRSRGGYEYQAPSIPASDLAELASRLQRLETAFSGMSAESVRERHRLEEETRGREGLAGRLASLEAKVRQEAARVGQSEEQARKWEREGLGEVRREIQSLQSQVAAAARRPSIGSDEEARARLKALEERLGGVEGGVKDALEASKNALKADPSKAAAAERWWHKLATSTAGKSALTIKSADGQDVTKLIGHLVDTAVGRYSKDVIARQDFALYSAGAGVIPQLTSETYEIRPAGVRGNVLGFLTGRGYAVGRPPVTALHHELAVGHCWPFRGSQGQLGIQLSAPVFVTEVTIDHVAKEVAFDMRSAPREMELWGMVEGSENVAKFEAWKAEKARLREERRVAAEIDDESVTVVEEDEEPAVPETLPTSAPWIRVAKLTYDVHSPENIQTFAADEEYMALGIDVGLVALRVESNWGQDEFTCLYRVRVHGEALRPAPFPPSLDDLS